MARRLVRAVVITVVLGVAVLGLVWDGTPIVDDAANRLGAHLARHAAPALQGPIPIRIADAVLASQDGRFYKTPGIDPVSLLRVPLAVVSGHRLDAATIEQQLAGGLYVKGGAGVPAGVEESVLALKLDRTWSKQQILRMYLDDGDYGHGFYGLTAASQGYFGVPPATLTWAQAALLAGLLQARGAADPFQDPGGARALEGLVLDRLVDVGDLTATQAAAVDHEPWQLSSGRRPNPR